MAPNSRPDHRTRRLVAMLSDAPISAKPTKYTQNIRHGMYDGTSGQQGLLAGKMFCAEDRQRDGEAQVGQGYDLVDAASLGNIVLRGQ